MILGLHTKQKTKQIQSNNEKRVLNRPNAQGNIASGNAEGTLTYIGETNNLKVMRQYWLQRKDV